MNMILHNITRFTIENGDTLEDPLILDNGQIRKFDRVLANPPFSQNYSRQNMKFANRFREFCPETGKKADLMFVQHMIASLKPDGRMATIMPHGVLFRGGKERLIREFFIQDDILEAIISLPPGLFYGTGIPACVLVVNKNKPDELRDKILFINADREFAEGKNQNKLRPEDIEKIDFVFTNKREIPKYARLVEKREIAEDHDYNLNIRRYVDNTPAPEPEDVQAHLIGGIPAGEVEASKSEFEKFRVDPATIFELDRPGYMRFKEEIEGKTAIKPLLEANPELQQILAEHHQALEDWWKLAQDDFAKLETNNVLPQVRSELLGTFKAKLGPLGVLDEFQSAGAFVNWWQAIRFDLKTIMSTGWHHALIPDEYLIAAFFQGEADAIEVLEGKISEAQAEVQEAVEEVEYEPDEDEKVTATVIKKHLKSMLDDLKDSAGESAAKERKIYQEQRAAIDDVEKRIKQHKAALKAAVRDLEIKLSLKRIGPDDKKAETQVLIQQVDQRLEELDSGNKDDKKKIAKLKKDKAILEERLGLIDGLMNDIGGQLEPEQAKQLILKKLYDLVSEQLARYLNAEKRELIAIIENLWAKYAVSSRTLEMERERTLSTLDEFVNGLGYLK